jgi:hypothetical protein
MYAAHSYASDYYIKICIYKRHILLYFIQDGVKTLLLFHDLSSYFLVALARFSLTNGTGSAGRLGALTGWNSLRLVGGVSTMS